MPPGRLPPEPLMYQEMLSIREIDLGGWPGDGGLDQIAIGIGVR